MLDQARFHSADRSGSSLKVGASGTLSVSGSDAGLLSRSSVRSASRSSSGYLSACCSGRSLSSAVFWSQCCSYCYVIFDSLSLVGVGLSASVVRLSSSGVNFLIDILRVSWFFYSFLVKGSLSVDFSEISTVSGIGQGHAGGSNSGSLVLGFMLVLILCSC
jgi:hypothetical protein